MRSLVCVTSSVYTFLVVVYLLSLSHVLTHCRQHAMELAATALAQAVGSGGAEGDSESSEDEEYDGRFASLSHRNPLMMSVNLQVKKAKKCKETKGHGSDGMSAVSASGVTIDALVGVLQDPDRGVPRALETRLKDVKIRRGE